jgi:hypothetical protein
VSVLQLTLRILMEIARPVARNVWTAKKLGAPYVRLSSIRTKAPVRLALTLIAQNVPEISAQTVQTPTKK